MKLENFPNEIKALAKQVVAIEDELTLLNEEKIDFEIDFDKEIYSDDSLKNEGMRKTRKLELTQETVKYRQLVRKIAERTRDKKFAEIELQAMKDRFNVAMLLKRQQSYRLEIQAKSL
jgi:hypothetical protein